MTNHDEIAELEGISPMHAQMWKDLDGLAVYHDWRSLRLAFARAVRETFAQWIPVSEAHFREQLAFALGRFDEGAGIVRYLERCNGEPPRDGFRILDIGAGNGGVAFALANCKKYRVLTLDIVPNSDLARLRRILDVPVTPLVATGHAIPLQAGTLGAAFLLDTIEHVPLPTRLGREIMRTLAPGGSCMVTTPPRLRHLLGPDPHFGVRGLLLLPNAVQRFIINKIYQRRIARPDGTTEPAYDVEHIFWHVREIARHFPHAMVDVLYNRALTPGRFPSRDWLAYRTREFFWDRIILRKPLAQEMSLAH